LFVYFWRFTPPVFNREFLLRIILILNLLAVAGLGISYLALFLSPEYFWMFAFMGLAYPILLLMNVLFLAFWLVVRWRRALFSGLIILVGISKVNDLYQWRKEPSEEQLNTINAQDSSLKVLSYNVRLFDLYNWTENKQTRNKIMDLIRSQQADILCFQEFFYEDTGAFNTLDTLLQIQPASHVHIEHTAHVKRVNHWGIATFSRFPIIEKGQIQFRDSTDNISIYTDIKAYGDTFRVYNLHLESIRFRREDYKTLQTITGNEDKTDLDGPQKIISRMRRAYIRRARQTDLIRTHIKESPHPVIVCGDFNDTPNSYAYHQISTDLNDAFRTAGTGIGTTYIGMIPFLRIDYILYSPEVFEALYFKVIRKKYSDHYPVISSLHIKQQQVKGSDEN
jgi:endonuclease/exonuclease/phosphatase family metal-dependent hydrolase